MPDRFRHHDRDGNPADPPAPVVHPPGWDSTWPPVSPDAVTEPMPDPDPEHRAKRGSTDEDDDGDDEKVTTEPIYG